MQNVDQQIDTVITTYLIHVPDLQNDPGFKTAVADRYLDYVVNLAAILHTAGRSPFCTGGSTLWSYPNLAAADISVYCVCCKKVYQGSWSSMILRTNLLFLGDIITTQLASAVAMAPSVNMSMAAFR
jgi:hypothetical protein